MMRLFAVGVEPRSSLSPLRKLLYLSTILAFVNFVSSQGVIQAVAGGQYGSDGPWNTIRVWLGSDHQQLDLYPGTFGASQVYAAGICGGASPSNCDVSQGGLYNYNTSSLSSNFSQPIFDDDPAFGWIFADSLSLSSPSSDNNYTVDGDLLFVAQESYFTYLTASGTRLNQSIGTLDVGKPSMDLDNSYANSTALFFREHGLTSSASFGLHFGSATKNIPISLTFGGYDPARVVGEVISNRPPTGDLDSNVLSISIKDISIVTTDGASPLGRNVTGLLAGANATLQGSDLNDVNLNPTLPYIQLPQDTVDGIVKLLPVTYDEGAGSYLWKVEDPMYKALTTSPTSLQFTFENVNQQVSINVPFALLDLTLTNHPGISSPTQYFPLRSDRCCGDNDLGSYILGRAFLQAVWLGANWSPEDLSKSVWWLAQAPGPDFPDSGQFETILNDQFEVTPSKAISWADTWSAALTPIGSSGGSNGSSSSSSSGGLSTGAKIGIGVGVGVGGLVVFVISWLLYRRYKKNKKKAAMPSPGPPKYDEQQYDTLSAAGSPQWQSKPPNAYSPEMAGAYPTGHDGYASYGGGGGAMPHLAEVEGSSPNAGQTREIHEAPAHEVRSELSS